MTNKLSTARQCALARAAAMGAFSRAVSVASDAAEFVKRQIAAVAPPPLPEMPTTVDPDRQPRMIRLEVLLGVGGRHGDYPNDRDLMARTIGHTVAALVQPNETVLGVSCVERK